MEEEEAGPSTSYHTLSEEYEFTKKSLVEAEESLKRITGRKRDLFNRPGGPNNNKWQQNKPLDLPGGRKRTFPTFRKNNNEDIEDTPLEEEESPDEDESASKKPSLQSRVVATSKGVKSRRDTIQEQNVNSKVKARNRRMLGMILGTLQKFQHDAKKTEEKDQKRAVIEKKVEAAEIEEKERVKKEKEELFHMRREKLIQLRCLEKKMEIADLHEAWENNHVNLANFIKTTAEPHIYFLPAKLNKKCEELLGESKKKTLDLIKERREQMERDLAEVEELYKKDTFPVDKENIGPLGIIEIKTENASPEVTQEPTEAEVENESTVDTEEPTTETNLPMLTDQEFEPIYD